MRKLIFGSAILFLLANCSSNGASEKSNEDSSSITDSIAKGEAAKDTTEQVRQDSVVKDTTVKEEESSNTTAEYDDLLNQYEKSVKNYQKFVRNFRGEYDKQPAYTKKCRNLYNKINKIKNKLSPAQNKKFKSLKSQYDQAYYSIQG